MKAKIGSKKTQSEPCLNCKGKGKIEYSECGRGCCGPFSYMACDSCNGTGKVEVKYKLMKPKWERS